MRPRDRPFGAEKVAFGDTEVSKKKSGLYTFIPHFSESFNVYKLKSQETKATKFVFAEQVTEGGSDGTFSNKLSSTRDLRNQGLYCFYLRAWRRYYLTQQHVAIRLYEDVTETGGQNSLWSAGLVLAHFIERWERPLGDARVMEMGAGAGLGAMVASTLGAARCVATEQPSCMPYLEANLAFNVESAPVEAMTLYWTTDDLKVKSGDQFDIILACDVTYDPSLFDALLNTMHAYLSRAPGAEALICHDNDSCPLSSSAETALVHASHSHGLSFEEIALKGKVHDCFYEPSVRLWRLRHV